LIQGYRHQKVGKIITITVIVEKVKRKKEKKGVSEEYVSRMKKKRKRCRGYSTEEVPKRQGRELEVKYPSVKTGASVCFSASG
jgi:hypothetical protein